ncbi:MAG: universal stress protein [Oleiphilaceae bacterium]|nr:universal stress protein [Oleiphilaceae bacterium]
MYSSIMVPIDLAHIDKLDKSLTTATDLAKLYSATVCYVGVTASVPTTIAHSREEFEKKFKQFAQEQADKYDIKARSYVVTTPDPVTEIDDRLVEAVADVGADLVVMSSHVPGVADHLHLMSSNASYIVKHTNVAVFVVR